MYGLTSYYWDTDSLKPRERRAVRVLDQTRDHAEVAGAVGKLLGSPRHQAQGIAMDQYH
ncbi:hypothetical protein [Actinoalloteichus hymeniacidonis]|uniref:Uncharacterized protein n=1 Tax=Actinoalloteichus hymeniacidonis TaxID=340345 RepID=A0AAC9HQD7_9PSEU|nr:hypothetical protein [Actinoalloteichus hymeniacidonis]AOS63589.1 hypothetical protein TL08_13875 [Actinoalloteichus hymeniacidonis]MBB5908365.1 hypothetical protein [Actinoalloteichus hymeniacidonis]